MDPLADEFYSSSPYNYVDGNPITRIDPDGRAWFTKYKDEDGKLLLDTKDGSDDVIIVPNSMKADFLESVKHTPSNMYDGAGGWNSAWKAKILGDEKFEYLENNQFSSQWARQAAIDYFQNPTASNFGIFSLAESLSQWTRPEMVISGLSIGVAGLPRNITAHGAQRIAGASATRGGVLSMEGVSSTKSLGKAFSQADGATVYLHEVSPGRFNGVVEGKRGIITTMSNWSEKSINRIAKNYGWNLK